MKKIGFCMLLLVGCVAVGADDAFEDAKWDDTSRDFSASLGYGYKENVLYSEVVPKDSSFSYATLEGIATGSLLNLGAEWAVMALADLRHYEDLQSVPDETFGVAVGEFTKNVGLFSEATVGLQYLYIHQAFDATFDIVDERTISLKAQEPELYFEWRSLLGEFEWATTVSTSRMYFADPEDDYETDGLEFELNYDFSDSSSVILTLEVEKRLYTDRIARDEEGYLATGVLRENETRSLELEWERSFSLGDATHSLGIEGKLSERVDPFAGYYNRERSRFGVEWELEWASWEVVADWGYTQSDYTGQLNEAGNVRSSDAWIGSLLVEKSINESWAMFLQLDIEEEESNESLYSYEANTLMFGFKFN